MNKEGKKIRLSYILGVSFIFILFVLMGFVSASNSVAMPSDCNKMIGSLSANMNPLMISMDMENKFIYVGFKDSTKKVAAFEYADCLRNIDGLIKNQIYNIGNVKINYYDSKPSVSNIYSGITGNVVATTTPTARTTSTPRSTTTRTTTTRTAVTTPAAAASALAKNAVSSGAAKTELNVDNIVDFRGYKYFAGNSGKRSSVYIKKEGTIYLQRPSFGGIVTDYFFPDKKLGDITSEPAGNFIDLDVSVEKSIGTELFSKLNGKMINDAGKVVSASASKELKIAGPDGTDIPSGIMIDGRGYLHPKNNPSETIGTIDKNGKISMYDPATYASATKASLGSVASAIHNTQATNGVIKSLAKVSTDGYSSPISRATTPSSAIGTTSPSTIRTTPGTGTTTPVTSTTSPRNTSPTIGTTSPGTTPPKTTTPTPTPTISCATRCAQSTGYDPSTITLLGFTQAPTPEQTAAQNQLRTNYETCVNNCNANGVTSPGLPVTKPGLPGSGTPSKPGIGGGTSPGGGSSKPGTGSKPSPGTGGSSGSCVAGSAAIPCGCSTPSVGFSGVCSSGMSSITIGGKFVPQFKTFECAGGKWITGVINCEGYDANGCKKVEGATACDPNGAPVPCVVPGGDEEPETSGVQKCVQDATTQECKLSTCAAKENEKKPALAAATKKKRGK